MCRRMNRMTRPSIAPRAKHARHPMLRARHLPYAIGNAERDQWMACMTQAMEEVGMDELLRLQLASALFKTADWMRNREE